MTRAPYQSPRGTRPAAPSGLVAALVTASITAGPAAARPPDPPPTAAPPGAIVLFDGAPIKELVSARGKAPVSWPVRDGELVVDRRAGDVLSRRDFGDCLLHVEWMSPPSDESRRAVDPAGGNSGVKLQSRYEIQILNTPPAPHEAGARDAGSIYGLKAAARNASTGAGTWQTFDIWFTAPRWEGRRKVAPARITMLWNSRLVHEDIEVPKQTGASAVEAPGDHPVLLQAHSSSAEDEVRFRNVWLLPDPARAGFPPPRRADAGRSDDP